MKTKKIDKLAVLEMLDTIYDKALNGIPGVSRSVEAMADGYLIRSCSMGDAAKMLMSNQIMKCAASGFATGIGGLMTLPISLPVNVSTVLYMQIRMAAAIACIGGFDIKSDKVKTLVFACMTGPGAAQVLKETGIKAGETIVNSALDKIPERVLLSVNQDIAGRLLVQMGLEGAEQMVKVIPLVGGVVGGAADAGSTKMIAKSAYDIFIHKKMPESWYLSEKYRRIADKFRKSSK